MLVRDDCTITDQQIATHAEMNQKAERRKVKDKVFGATINIQNLLTLNLLFELLWRWRGKCAMPAQVYRENRFANQRGPELTYKGFDFGEFRHISFQLL